MMERYKLTAQANGYWVNDKPNADGWYVVYHMNTFFVPEELYRSEQEAWKGICTARRLKLVRVE